MFLFLCNSNNVHKFNSYLKYYLTFTRDNNVSGNKSLVIRKMEWVDIWNDFFILELLCKRWRRRKLNSMSGAGVRPSFEFMAGKWCDALLRDGWGNRCLGDRFRSVGGKWRKQPPTRGLWCEGKSGSGKVGEESEAGVANGGHESWPERGFPLNQRTSPPPPNHYLCTYMRMLAVSAIITSPKTNQKPCIYKSYCATTPPPTSLTYALARTGTSILFLSLSNFSL